MPAFDRFDVCEAYYMFACLYHSGMSSPEYRLFTRLHRMRFEPRPSISVESLTDNSRAIFDALVARKGHEPYQSDYGYDEGEVT